jgi:hypothetical protein
MSPGHVAVMIYIGCIQQEFKMGESNAFNRSLGSFEDCDA